MPLPKGFKKQLKLRPQVVGPERRQDILDGIADGGTFLPRGVDYEDMDKSFINFVEEDLKIEIDGEQVPVLFLTIQRYSEFTKSWKFTDQYRNISMPFITIVRQADPQVGTNQAGLYNIPGRQNWTYYKVPSNDGARQGIDVYKVPQPTATDITYEVRFFTNKMSDLNVLNQKIQKAFNAIQYYIWPKGHPMPVKLNNIGDESNIEDFENRRFYVQNFEMLLQGYILDEKDFEVQPTINRMMVLNEISEDPATAEPRERKRDRGPIIPAQGSVIIRNSASQNLASVECDSTYVVGNSEIINSGSTFSVSVPATSGYTLPNITHIDSNGAPVTLPAQTPFTATTCESGSTIYNSDSGYTQQVLAGSDLTLPDTPIFSSASGFSVTTPSVTTGYTIPDVTWVDSDGSTGTTEYGDLITCTPVQQPLQANIVAYADSGATSAITSTTYGNIVYLRIETTGATAVENYIFELPKYDNTRYDYVQTGDTFAWTADTYGKWSISAKVKDTGVPTAYDVAPMEFMTRRDPIYWDKPNDYLDMPAITGGSTTEVINLLVAVYDREHNYIAMDIEGDYTVDWGDGNIINYGSGVQANYDYSYSSISTATTTSEGFRQVIAVVTPQGGNNLTNVNFDVQHSAVTSSNWSSSIVEVETQMTGCTAFEMGGTYYHRQLMKFNWIGTNGVTTWNGTFQNCANVEEIHVSFDSATSSLRPFRYCYNLTNVNDGVIEFPNAGTFRYIFDTCYALPWIESFSAPLSTNIEAAFNQCYGLVGVGSVYAPNNSTYFQFYANCSSLKYAPLIDTSSITTVGSMHSTNRTIEYIPHYNTSASTTHASFALNCNSLVRFPDLDYTSSLSLSNLADNCYGLVYFPPIYAPIATAVRSMLRGCYGLSYIPAIRLPSATDYTNFMNTCYAVTDMSHESDFSAAETMNNAFANLWGLKTFPPFFSGGSLTDMLSFGTTSHGVDDWGDINTSGVTTMQTAFQACKGRTFPTLDCTSNTTLYRTFFQADGFTVLDFIINTESVTNFRELVRDNYTVTEIRNINWSGATNMTNTFQNAYNLSRIVGGNIPITFTIANCNFEATEIDELFTDLPTVAGQNVTVTGNPGAAGCDPSIATGKGWSVTT